MDMTNALTISAAGMDAQSTRLQVIAENLANVDTTGTTPGAAPYQRQTVTFSICRIDMSPCLGRRRRPLRSAKACIWKTI